MSSIRVSASELLLSTVRRSPVDIGRCCQASECPLSSVRHSLVHVDRYHRVSDSWVVSSVRAFVSEHLLSSVRCPLVDIDGFCRLSERPLSTAGHSPVDIDRWCQASECLRPSFCFRLLNVPRSTSAGVAKHPSVRCRVSNSWVVSSVRASVSEHLLSTLGRSPVDINMHYQVECRTSPVNINGFC